MKSKITTIITSEECDVTHVAILTCDNSTITSSQQLHDAIMRGVTAWMGSVDGQEYYKEVGHFSIWDLWTWSDDPEFLSFLEKEGIMKFQIECFTDHNPSQWGYNEELINGL